MGNACERIFLLLLVGAVTAQTAPPYGSERLLPQWLVGIIAVSCFLLLTFISFLIKKVWCGETSRRITSVESVRDNQYVDSSSYETNLDAIRSRNSMEVEKENSYETSLDVLRNQSRRNIYDNIVMDRPEDKSTSM